MISPTELTTPRLKLRQWRESDLTPSAAMNADADVMRYYPATWTKEESDSFAQRIMRLIDERGWGFWALEERESRQFIGFVGLHTLSKDLPFAPCVEVGWRLTNPIGDWVMPQRLRNQPLHSALPTWRSSKSSRSLL